MARFRIPVQEAVSVDEVSTGAILYGFCNAAVAAAGLRRSVRIRLVYRLHGRPKISVICVVGANHLKPPLGFSCTYVD